MSRRNGETCADAGRVGAEAMEIKHKGGKTFMIGSNERTRECRIVISVSLIRVERASSYGKYVCQIPAHIRAIHLT